MNSDSGIFLKYTLQTTFFFLVAIITIVVLFFLKVAENEQQIITAIKQPVPEHSIDGADIADGSVSMQYTAQNTQRFPAKREAVIAIENKPSEVQPVSPADALADIFSQALLDYHSRDNEVADRHTLFGILRDLNRSPEGRQVIIDSFYSTQSPTQAEITYDLLLDADLKDTSLIVSLIDRSQFEQKQAFEYRMLDLIADLETAENLPYHPEIEKYLSQLSKYPDKDLREKAISRHLWYLTQHSKMTSSHIDEFLLNPSRNVRAELYEWIELIGMEKQGIGIEQQGINRYELQQSMQNLLYADYLGVDEAEKQQVSDWIQQLSADRESW